MKKKTAEELRMRLYEAIRDKSSTTEQIRQLIAAGASLNNRNNQLPPLFVAAKAGRTDIIQILLDADEGKKRTRPEMALAYAVYGGHGNIVRTLFDAGADANTEVTVEEITHTRKYGKTRESGTIPLLFLAIMTERQDIIDLLLDAGANINCKTEEHTPLSLVVCTGDLKLMQHLIDRGADVNGSTEGYTPLIAAAKEGCEEGVRFLLSHGADANAGTAKYTPLTAAAEGAQKDILRILLEAGANVNAGTINENHTPLTAAARTGFTEGVRLLIDAGADVNLPSLFYTPLAAAAEGSHADILRILLAAGADLSGEADGNTPLIAAAKAGFTEGVRLLLDAGADVNLSTLSYTPLIAAAMSGNTRIVRMLLDAGADVNAEAGGSRETALMAALGQNHLSLARRLRRAGAIDHPKKYGWEKNLWD